MSSTKITNAIESNRNHMYFIISTIDLSEKFSCLTLMIQTVNLALIAKVLICLHN